MSEAAFNTLKTSKNDERVLTSKQNEIKIFLAVSQPSLFQNWYKQILLRSLRNLETVSRTQNPNSSWISKSLWKLVSLHHQYTSQYRQELPLGSVRLSTLANIAWICQEKMQITSKPRHNANYCRLSVPINRLIKYKYLEKHLYNLVSYSQGKTSTAINTIRGDKPEMRLIWIHLQGTKKMHRK